MFRRIYLGAVTVETFSSTLNAHMLIQGTNASPILCCTIHIFKRAQYPYFLPKQRQEVNESSAIRYKAEIDLY